jgi:hypothetical protein
MPKVTARFALPLLLLAMTTFSVADPEVKRTYSDVQYVEESGDRVGVEVQMTMGHDGKVTGVLLHYEGLDAHPIAFVGRLDTDRLTASGSMADTRVTIEARLLDERLIGVIRYHLTRQVNEIEIDLPKVTRTRAKKE